MRFVLILTAAQAVAAWDWVGKSGGGRRTGASSYNGPNLSKAPTWTWVPPKGDLLRATPVVDEQQNVYMVTLKGYVHKFSPNGQVLWSSRPCESIPSVPVLQGEALFAGCSDGLVFAVSLVDGAERWKVRHMDLAGIDTWSMTAWPGVVMSVGVAHSRYTVAGGNSNLIAMNESSGELLWKFETDDNVYNVVPAVVDDTLVFSDERGTCYRIRTDGQLLWKTAPWRAGWSTGGSAVSPDGIVFVTSNLMPPGVELPESMRHWYNPPMGMVLTKQQTGLVSAYRLDGTQIWNRTLELPANTGPAVSAAGVLVVPAGSDPAAPDYAGDKWLGGSKPMAVQAFDAASGAELWKLQLPDWHGAMAGETQENLCQPDSFSTPAIGADGTAYMGAEDGNIYAINDADADGAINRTELLSFDTGFGFQSSAALGPNFLAIASCGGLYVW